MRTTNRQWQNHLKCKGIIPFFFDRLKSHSFSSDWQYETSPFNFKIKTREKDDELSRAYFDFMEHFPFDFHIEVTNKCNLSCKMCARQFMKRPSGVMAMGLYKKIVNEIRDRQPYANLHYYHIGEPLLDPHLFKRIQYAINKGLRNVGLFTNGQLLLENDHYMKLADSGVNSIGIDLDGFSQKVYEKIRIGGKFKTVKSGIERLHAYVQKNKLNVRLEIAYQIYPKVNDDDVKPFVKWCEQNDYEYKLVTMHVWTGVNEEVPTTNVDGLADMHHGKRRSPCCALWSSLVVDWDGKVALCFQDADQRDVLGDLNMQTIAEIWDETHFKKRKEHVAGIFTGLCNKCPNFTNVGLPNFNSPIYPLKLRR